MGTHSTGKTCIRVSFQLQTLTRVDVYVANLLFSALLPLGWTDSPPTSWELFNKDLVNMQANSWTLNYAKLNYLAPVSHEACLWLAEEGRLRVVTRSEGDGAAGIPSARFSELHRCSTFLFSRSKLRRSETDRV